ncbi:ATP synthase delta subunit-domain-containing protein [Aspergillus nidulans var. acristatus]
MLSARLARAGLRASAQVSVPRNAAVNGLRTYATAAQEVKPPVSLFGVDGTYATALYTASAKSSSLDATSKALNNLGAALKADPKLTSIISTPTLSAADKQAIVTELQKVAGADKGDILKNFLATLAENNRLGLLNDVVDKFAALMSAHRGEIELSITSAQVCFLDLSWISPGDIVTSTCRGCRY